MQTKLSLLAAALYLSACATPWSDREEPAYLAAGIGGGRELHLPLPPAYPEALELRHIIRADYGVTSGTFEASVSLKPDQVVVVVTAPQGPRLATITWTAAGVDVDRTLLAPIGLPAENILSDIFVLSWPQEMVQSAAPDGCTVTDAEDGARTIACNGAPVIEIARDPERANRRILRNLDLGYTLTITSLQ